MHLLHARILEEIPEADVYIFPNWPEETLPTEPKKRMEKCLPGFPLFKGRQRYFLFDEGQTSYWDDRLWLLFKNSFAVDDPERSAFAIIFCSYGNGPVRTGGKPAPPSFGSDRVTLNRTSRRGSKPFGLLLDKEEYDDVIKRQAPKLCISDDLRDFVYHLTSGHIGSVLGVVDFLLSMVIFS